MDEITRDQFKVLKLTHQIAQLIEKIVDLEFDIKVLEQKLEQTDIDGNSVSE